MRVARRLLLVVLPTLLIIGGFSCADRLILPPAPQDAASSGATRRTFVHDGHSVEIFTARSDGASKGEPRAFVLRFTGGDASAAAAFTASRWRQRPVEVWVVNYPGSGGSTGPRTLRALASTSIAAFDELKRVAVDRPIFLEGFSLGTLPALHVAAQRPAAGLILQNPPPLTQVILGYHGWWNLWLLAGPVALQVPREFDSIANAKTSAAPAIFLTADQDRSVPQKYQQKIINAYHGEKRVIVQRGADHVAPLTEDQQAQLESGMDWLMQKAASISR